MRPLVVASSAKAGGSVSSRSLPGRPRPGTTFDSNVSPGDHYSEASSGLQRAGICMSVLLLLSCSTAGKDSSADVCGPYPDSCCSPELCGIGSCEAGAVGATCRCNTSTGEWEADEPCDGAPNPPDAAPPLACDPVAQVGCGPGQKCAAILDDAARMIGHVGCAPDGTAAIDEPCTEAEVDGGSDSCAAGGECYNGYCHRICTVSDSNCGDGWCVTVLDGNTDIWPIEFCLPACDLLAQDCASPREGCYHAFGLSVCIDLGIAPLGAPCEFANECEPGLHCTGSPGAPGVCRRLCGPLLDCWERDMDTGQLTTPTACGCGPTVSCTETQLCWPMPDVEGTPTAAGVCFDDVERDECNCAGDPICTL